MPIWRLQCAMAGDTSLPRDYASFNPVFNDHGITTDPGGLASDLADALASYFSGTRHVIVKAYDAQGSKPVYPAATEERNVGGAPTSTHPRELAVCLSFKGGAGPSKRGRLYVPAYMLGAEATVDTLRPNPGTRDKVAALVPIFTGLGGADVDWSVYSQKLNSAVPVSHWWVDDEWDVVRSRGLRATTRTEGDVSE